MNILRRNHKFKKNGTTVIEMAIVLPLLLWFTFTAIRYGWLFFKYQQIANAARYVARVAIRPGDRSSDIANAFDIWKTKTEISDAQYSVFTGDVDSNGNPVSNNSADVSTGSNMLVSVWVPTAKVDVLDIGMFSLIPLKPNLTVNIEMTKEGPH